jgi:adenosine kinase
MTRQRGGCAPNIAYTMALLGERPRVWNAGVDFSDTASGWKRMGLTPDMLLKTGEIYRLFLREYRS